MENADLVPRLSLVRSEAHKRQRQAEPRGSGHEIRRMPDKPRQGQYPVVSC